MAVAHVSVGEYVGRVLRHARVMHNVSCREISQELNIPEQKIEALEKGDFSVFAADVYAYGAYVTYARRLGIDVEREHQAVWRAIRASRERVNLKIHTPARWINRMFTPWTFLGVGSSLAALAISGYIAWHVRSFWQLPYLAILEPTQSILESDEIMVRGQSEADVNVRVNGETILLHDDYSFVVPMVVQPGITIIRVEAKNVAGRTSIIEKHVLLPRYEGRFMQ